MTPVLSDIPDLSALTVPDRPVRFRERARYQLPGVTRVLCTRVANGRTLLIDMPAEQFDATSTPIPGKGSYIVEASSGGGKELAGLIAEYLRQADVHKRVPMTTSAFDEDPDQQWS